MTIAEALDLGEAANKIKAVQVMYAQFKDIKPTNCSIHIAGGVPLYLSEDEIIAVLNLVWHMRGTAAKKLGIGEEE
jgi:hypothetical protein